MGQIYRPADGVRVSRRTPTLNPSKPTSAPLCVHDRRRPGLALIAAEPAPRFGSITTAVRSEIDPPTSRGRASACGRVRSGRRTRRGGKTCGGHEERLSGTVGAILHWLNSRRRVEVESRRHPQSAGAPSPRGTARFPRRSRRQSLPQPLRRDPRPSSTATVDLLHWPPRGAAICRRFSSSAMPRTVTMPDALMVATMGVSRAASARAFALLALASFTPFLPSLTPRRLLAASASFVHCEDALRASSPRAAFGSADDAPQPPQPTGKAQLDPPQRRLAACLASLLVEPALAGPTFSRPCAAAAVRRGRRSTKATLRMESRTTLAGRTLTHG